MLKFYNTLIGLQEIQDEVSLLINISNCPFRCANCHAEVLRSNVGYALTEAALYGLVNPLVNKITCVTFMGGDAEPWEINALADYLKRAFPSLKVGWYSGDTELGCYTDIHYFDYIKIGPYDEKAGPLNSPTTNQRLYKIENAVMKDITSKFWK